MELPETWEALRPVAGTLAFYFDVTGKKEAALIRLVVKAFYGEREVVLESPADSAEEPELRPASSQAFRDQDLEDAGVAVAAQFFDGSMTLPLRQTELAGDLLYGGLVQFLSLIHISTGQEATDPVFAAEQAHLSETYGKLEKIGRDAIAAMEVVARDAAEDKKSMAEELAVNFATWDDILETHADIVAMNNIIEAHDMANSCLLYTSRCV